MRTEVIEVTLEHFEWRKNEAGELYKHKLSDTPLIKKQLVTYDDNGVEINRENYIEQQPVNISGVDINTLTDDQIQALRIRLGL
jgi:hypothetical protein